MDGQGLCESGITAGPRNAPIVPDRIAGRPRYGVPALLAARFRLPDSRARDCSGNPFCEAKRLERKARSGREGGRRRPEKKTASLTGALCLLIAAVIFASCSKEDEKIAERIAEFESPSYTASPDNARIAELERDVAKYKDMVEKKVNAADTLGTYYKLLALAYLDKAMYGKALEAIEDAIRIHPEQHGLFIYRGISAARFAKALKNEAERDQYMRIAEDSYLRAIAIDPSSTQAMYGLAVLYIYELDKAENALPLVEGILRRESKNVDAMFLLAAVHYLMGNTEAALEAYDKIIATSDAGTRRDEARKNKERIFEEALR
jgi:tetratricopeptide (TPR) repeat protein